MPQATSPGILENIFARFQKRKGANPPAKPGVKQQQQQAPEIDPKTGKPKQQQQIQQQQQQQQQQEPQRQSQDEQFDPLSLYEGLYDAPDPEETRKNEPPKFLLSADKVKEAADKMDFTAGLPDEVVQKLQSGDGIDGKTLLAAINFVGRQTYTRALEHATGLTGHFVEARVAHERQGLPEVMRKHLANSRVVSNPNVSDNPVIREHMKFISEKVASRFPEATEEEIASLTQEYFTEMARAINPKAFQPQPGEQPRQRGRDEVVVEDWGNYLQGSESENQQDQA